MNNRFVAFDVETPNFRNERMSAIGVAIIEDGKIVEELYSLVNPEQHFDRYNVELTGISPRLVETAPTFSELWKELRPIFDNSILVAHNAPFDMGILAKCLNAYQINWRDEAQYLCTYAMGRVCYPELENHRLNTLCDALEIELDHHNAGSDSHACASLLLDYLEQGMTTERFLRYYDICNVKTLSRR